MFSCLLFLLSLMTMTIAIKTKNKPVDPRRNNRLRCPAEVEKLKRERAMANPPIAYCERCRLTELTNGLINPHLLVFYDTF